MIHSYTESDKLFLCQNDKNNSSNYASEYGL